MARVSLVDFIRNFLESRLVLFVGSRHCGAVGGAKSGEEVHGATRRKSEGGWIFVLCFGDACDWKKLGVNERACVSNNSDVHRLFFEDYAYEVHGESTAHAKATCECSGGTGATAAIGSGSPWVSYVDGDEGAVDFVGGGDDVIGVLLSLIFMEGRTHT
jgi:hypothetical protein